MARRHVRLRRDTGTAMALNITMSSELTRKALLEIANLPGYILPVGVNFVPDYNKLDVPKRACRCTNCGAQGWAGHKCEYCGRPV